MSKRTANLVRLSGSQRSLTLRATSEEIGRLPVPVAVLLALFAALGLLLFDMYLPGVSQMAADLQASPRMATASLSIFFAGMTVGMLFTGPWTDRVGRRMPLLSGLALALVGTVSFCLSVPRFIWAETEFGGLPVLLSLVMLVVASNGLVQANATASVLSIAPRSVGSIAALFGALLFTSGALASFVAGWTFDGTPRGMIIIMGLAMLCVAAPPRWLAHQSRLPPN